MVSGGFAEPTGGSNHAKARQSLARDARWPRGPTHPRGRDSLAASTGPVGAGGAIEVSRRGAMIWQSGDQLTQLFLEAAEHA